MIHIIPHSVILLFFKIEKAVKNIIILVVCNKQMIYDI